MTHTVEPAELVGEPTSRASAPLYAPPAGESSDAPSPAEAAGGDVEEVEELDAEDLMTEAPPALAQGIVETTIADERAALSEGGGARRITFYETELAAVAKGEPDKLRVALYQHEIGELLEERGDEGAAVKAYAKALQSDATLKPNLWAIRRVFQRRQLWPNLLKLIDAEIRFAKGDAEKAELLVEKGHLLEDRLEQPAAAIDCYQKATEAAPSCVAAWMALEKVATRDGDLGGLARCLRGLATATVEPGRKVALLIDLARLQDQIGGTLDQALALAREAAGGTVEPELVGRALDELERLALPAGRTEDLLWALDVRAQLAQVALAQAGAAERPQIIDRTVAVRRRQAQLARESDPQRAWAYLDAALQVAPAEPLLQRDLAQLAETLGRWDDLAALLGRRLETAPPAARFALQLERAEALRRAGKSAEAEACEADVAREAPQHLGLLIGREREALRAGDAERLATLYLQEAEIAASDRTPTGAPDPLWAATAFTQAGSLFGDRLGREAEALAALGRALTLVPGFRLAVEALERLYARAGKHAEHAALLEEELKSNPTPERARRLYETLIAVRDGGLGDAAGAAAAARKLSELRPDDLRVRLRVIELDRAAGRFADVAEALAALARALPPEAQDRKLDVILERADVLERRLGDDAAAADAYKEALAIRPGDPRAAESFESLSRRRSGKKPASAPHEKPSREVWDDLAQALRREAEASLKPERVALALLKLGEVHERERGHFADAAQAYRDLLDRSPQHPAALRGLARAYEGMGDEQRRAEALEAELDTLAEPSSKAVALTLLGELYEDRLKKDDEADDAYGRALALGTTEASAHAALGRFRAIVRRRDGGALVESLAQLGALVGEASGASDESTPRPPGAVEAARAALLDERAWAVRAAGETDASLDWIREALSQAGAGAISPRLQRARVAARAGEIRELGDALDQLAAGATDPVLQGVFARRAGLLALGSDGREQAAHRLRKGQSVQPSDPELVIPLCDLSPDPDALAVRIGMAEGPSQLEWMLERAEALESAGRLAEAGKEVARALTMDPRHLPALEQERRLARAGGDEAGHARATARVASEVQDAERAAALYADAGARFERLGQREAAALAFRAVLDRTPLDGSAFNRARSLLTALHAERRHPGPLVELYTHRLGHVQDDGDRIGLYLDRAELLAQEGDREGAERDLRAVLAINGDHLGAMRRLAELLAPSPIARGEAVSLLQRYLSQESGQEHRRSALLRLAELEELPGGKAEAAVEHLETAIDLAPTKQASLPDLERLAALLGRQRTWQKAIAALQRIVALHPPGSARAAAEIRIATAHRDGLSDARAAVEAVMRALNDEPLNLEALAMLVAFGEKGQVLQLELDDRLERAIELARGRHVSDPDDVAPLHALNRLWGWRGDEDARTIAAQAQSIARGEPPLGRDDALDPTKELSAQGWERVLPEVARGVALDVWRLATEASIKLYGPALESLGVGKNERVNQKTLPPQWTKIDKIARSLGCVGYELYAARDRDACAVAGPALVCGAAFTEKLTPLLRFRAAQKLALVRDRLAPLERLDDDELALFFAACARVAEVGLPPTLRHVDARVEERAKAVGKALGRKERKGLVAIGARLVELPDPGAWRRAILDGATRVAMVVCGDLGAALGELGPAARQDGRARALTQFALSADYLALRREMGLRS